MTKTVGTGPITGDHENSNNRRSGAITASCLPERSRKRSRRSRNPNNRWSSDHAREHGRSRCDRSRFPPPLYRGEGNVRSEGASQASGGIQSSSKPQPPCCPGPCVGQGVSFETGAGNRGRTAAQVSQMTRLHSATRTGADPSRCEFCSRPGHHGSPADTGLNRRIVKAGKPIGSRHLVSTQLPSPGMYVKLRICRSRRTRASTAQPANGWRAGHALAAAPPHGYRQP